MSDTTVPVTRTAASSVADAPVIAESPTSRGRRARIALRTLQVVLALFYVIASALPKLIAHPSAVEGFDRWAGAVRGCTSSAFSNWPVGSPC